VFCGIDWAEAHHDIAIVDPEGRLVGRQQISDDAAGFAELVELLATHGDRSEAPIPVAIETSRGLLVACLRATGRPVFAINPLAVARYRERHSVARKKSDRGDALVLANADFHATGSAQGSGELVAQGAVAPPGDGGLGGEAGFAQHG
jgi:transposase